MKSPKLMIKTVFISIFIITGFTQFVYAQAEERPPREYTNPEEMISFDRRTPFQDAIEVLTNYAQQYENRFIIDRTNTTVPIGVSLPAMHWKDALNYIMRVQGLVVLESEDILEIVTQQEAEELAGTTEDSVQSSGIAGEELDGISITTDTREVRINATFFEGNKRALQEIGVDWSTISNAVPENLGDFLGEESSETLPSTEFDGRFVSVSSKGAQNVSQSVFNSIINFGDIGGGIEVQALFSAFEADNLGKILATPSVKVMDGQEGRIQVGQDFSIKQRDFAGNVTDQFFSTGTILLVRPQIVEVGDTTLIYLELEAERSSAQPDPVSTVINKQQANTHALLLDGESTVIAGLYRTEEAEVRRGIPILKDLPGWFFGLKYLFGYNSTDHQESELIVLLQAELEDPLDERIERAFKSKSDLLSEKQEQHRNGMNYISDRSTIESPSLGAGDLDSSVSDADEIQTAAQDTNGTRRTLETVEKEDIDMNEIRPSSEYAGIQETPLQRRDLSGYQGAYKEMEMQNVNSNHGEYEFYVIGGSFEVRSNADRLYRNFKEEGLDAHMLYNPVSGYFFVAYKGFEAKEESIEYVKDIQANRQPEAWLSRLIRQERRLELNGE
jgi:type IV pilus assembly protein PilQ